MLYVYTLVTLVLMRLQAFNIPEQVKPAHQCYLLDDADIAN